MIKVLYYQELIQNTNNKRKIKKFTKKLNMFVDKLYLAMIIIYYNMALYFNFKKFLYKSSERYKSTIQKLIVKSNEYIDCFLKSEIKKSCFDNRVELNNGIICVERYSLFFGAFNIINNINRIVDVLSSLFRPLGDIIIDESIYKSKFELPGNFRSMKLFYSGYEIIIEQLFDFFKFSTKLPIGTILKIFKYVI